MCLTAGVLCVQGIWSQCCCSAARGLQGLPEGNCCSLPSPALAQHDVLPNIVHDDCGLCCSIDAWPVLNVMSVQDLCREYNIPTGTYEVFRDPEAAKGYIREQGAPIVVKAVGLAAGKGVVVARTVEEAAAAVDDMLVERKFGEAGERCPYCAGFVKLSQSHSR